MGSVYKTEKEAKTAALNLKAQTGRNYFIFWQSCFTAWQVEPLEDFAKMWHKPEVAWTTVGITPQFYAVLDAEAK